MKGIKSKAKSYLISHGIRYMEREDNGKRVSLAHIKTPFLVNAAAALAKENGDNNY